MELLSYLLKVSTCLVLFFAFYMLILRRLTFFSANRFYLLAGLLLSFVVPTLHLTIERAVAPEEIAYGPTPMQGQKLESVTELPLQQVQPSNRGLTNVNWLVVLSCTYIAVVLGILILAAWQLFRLYQYTRQKTEIQGDLKLVHKATGFTNCSFFNYVFIDQDSLNEDELDVLLGHEEVHAKQYHSIDKMVMIVVKAVLWFNPIVYLYDRALEEVHEYEADGVTAMRFGTVAYANLLLKLAVSKRNEPLIHNFVKSPVKKRIQMLFNPKTNNMKKLTYLAALPIGLALVWMFATEIVYASIATQASVQKHQPLVQPKMEAFTNDKGKQKVKPLLSGALRVKNDSDTTYPKLLQSASVREDKQSDILYVKKGKIALPNVMLEAEEIAWDKRNQTLTAKDGSIRSKGQLIVEDEYIVYDLKAGTYMTTKTPGNKIVTKPRAFKLLSALKYNNDSLKQYIIADESMLLSGPIKMNVDQYHILAKFVSANKNSDVIKAYMAQLKQPDGTTISADVIEFDIVTKKTTIGKMP